MGEVIVFESPFGGSLFFNVICVFLTIRTLCHGGGGGEAGKESHMSRRKESICVCYLEQIPGGPQWGWR